MKFDLPEQDSSIIKVIGVGGGGSNAVNYMYNKGIQGVDFIVCNTDSQALEISPVPTKIQLGASLTEGRGAGSKPEIGKNAAIENIDEVQDFLFNGTKMVFITAGMGGGTGTGAAPVIAQVAKDMGILTVGIVTIPFMFEGRKRQQQAQQGLEEMRRAVDTLLVINNDRLREMYGNLTLSNAFTHADDILRTAAQGIAETISITGYINVDFNDVNTVMKDSGVAIMGQAVAEGQERATKAVTQALASPLLNDNDIKGAKFVLLNITHGDEEPLMDEITLITDYIQEEAGSTADVIWGQAHDGSLGNKLGVTIVATGFQDYIEEEDEEKNSEKEVKMVNLDDDVPTMITQPITSPTASFNHGTHKQHTQVEPYLKKETKPKPEPVKPEPQQTRNEFQHVTEVKPMQTPTVKKVYLDDNMDEIDNNTIQNTTTKTLFDDLEDSSKLDEEKQKEDMKRRTHERINRIKEMQSRLKTADGITDLESQPAYLRRNVNLEDQMHSSETNVSRFTLGEENNDKDKKSGGLRENNSFLHDNVD